MVALLLFTIGISSKRPSLNSRLSSRRWEGRLIIASRLMPSSEDARTVTVGPSDSPLVGVDSKDGWYVGPDRSPWCRLVPISVFYDSALQLRHQCLNFHKRPRFRGPRGTHLKVLDLFPHFRWIFHESSISGATGLRCCSSSVTNDRHREASSMNGSAEESLSRQCPWDSNRR